MPGIGEKNGFLAEVVFNFTLLPHGFGERCAAGQRLVDAIEQSESNQIRLCFLKPKEVFTRSVLEDWW